MEILVLWTKCLCALKVHMLQSIPQCDSVKKEGFSEVSGLDEVVKVEP